MIQILIAEDDLTSRTILTGILKKWGYDPVAVGNGIEALEVMQSKTLELAILDWEMPGMDGLEVCQKIRKFNTPSPPYLIILTAKGEKTNIVKGLDAGANDYISKPYDNEELHARIRVGQRMIELQNELIEARDALAHEAMHDPLTGALNRRAILEGLKTELKRVERRNSTVSIGLCDIDFFKKVNDTYGHQVGDEVLCEFVSTLRKSLRGYDLLGRYGGEEFLVVAPDSNGSASKKLFERLRAQVSDFRITTDSGDVGITMSVGVAGVDVATTVDELVGAADVALYQAKEAGRNRVVCATTDEHVK